MNTTQLKKYNTAIKVEVQVDAIAEKLYETLHTGVVNKEGIVDAIIGSALTRGSGLGFLYNALAGVSNDLAIQVGQKMMCSDKVRQYKNDAAEGDEQPIWKPDWIAIGECEVVAVNPYASSPVTVKFFYTDSRGNKVEDTKDVDLDKLEELAPVVAASILQPA